MAGIKTGRVLSKAQQRHNYRYMDSVWLYKRALLVPHYHNKWERVGARDTRCLIQKSDIVFGMTLTKYPASLRPHPTTFVPLADGSLFLQCPMQGYNALTGPSCPSEATFWARVTLHYWHCVSNRFPDSRVFYSFEGLFISWKVLWFFVDN